MTILRLGSVIFPTHAVVVSKDLDSDRIYCFKMNTDRCDLDSFTTENEAAEYCITPLATMGYRLVIDGEESE